MIPIFEQGDGRGIGYQLESFLARFDDICTAHLQRGRATSFAFIFYNFVDQELRDVLKDYGVFARLDRLAGETLSVFYLHTASAKAIKSFNSTFLSKLELEASATPPCVVFFRMTADGIEDISVAQLDSTNLIHGFHELYEIINVYIKEENENSLKDRRYIRWTKSATRFVTIEGFRALLRKGLDNWIF